MRFAASCLAGLFMGLSSLTLWSAEPPAVPTATADASGQVTLLCETPDAVIRYTIDGSDPHAKSGLYLAPIDLRAGGVVKARAFTADRKLGSGPAEWKVEPVAGTLPLPSTLVPCTQDRDFPIYDWSVRHVAVTKQVQVVQPELVFIGDSITQMFGGVPHDRSQPGKDVWDRYYGSRKVANLGFGYDFVENTLWRLRHGELDAARAKVVVLHIGTNNVHKNSPEEIVAGIRAILDEIRRSQPRATIVLMGILPRGPKPDATRDQLRLINEQLAKLGREDRVRYLDIGAKYLQPDGTLPKELMGDYLHPTAAGYEIWAAALEPLLRELLGEPDAAK